MNNGGMRSCKGVFNTLTQGLDVYFQFFCIRGVMGVYPGSFEWIPSEFKEMRKVISVFLHKFFFA
jgi:hypothetical protein